MYGKSSYNEVILFYVIYITVTKHLLEEIFVGFLVNILYKM
jgi:hypothetical protein